MTTRDRFAWFLVGILAFCSACANGCTNPFGPGPNPPPGPPAELGGYPWAGGSPSVGGVESGGVPGAGGSVSQGGASAAGASSTVAIEWPECAPKAQKAKPIDVERYRRSLMPKRDQPIRRKARASYTVLDLQNAFWLPLAPTLDQLDLGSCTGNSALQVRVSKPWTWVGTFDPLELERLAVSVYSDATKLDPFEGSYPPDDTGSDGDSVMTVMQRRGLISGWSHVVTFEGLQRELQSGPCIMGSNWYTGMFSPDRCGQLAITGAAEGGHEYTIKGIDFGTKRIVGLNSWGNDWGAKLRGTQGGFFWLKFGDVQRLMNEGAEIDCPQVAAGNQYLR
jgi:hypothetical protein